MPARWLRISWASSRSRSSVTGGSSVSRHTGLVRSCCPQRQICRPGDQVATGQRIKNGVGFYEREPTKRCGGKQLHDQDLGVPIAANEIANRSGLFDGPAQGRQLRENCVAFGDIQSSEWSRGSQCRNKGTDFKGGRGGH